MGKSEILKDLKYTASFIHSKLDELERLKGIATHMTAVYSDLPRGKNSVSDKRQEILCQMADLESLINEEIEKYLKRIKEAEEKLQKIEGVREKSILTDRYISGMTLDEIGDKFNYTRQGLLKQLSKIEKALEN